MESEETPCKTFISEAKQRRKLSSNKYRHKQAQKMKMMKDRLQFLEESNSRMKTQFSELVSDISTLKNLVSTVEKCESTIQHNATA